MLNFIISLLVICYVKAVCEILLVHVRATFSSLRLNKMELFTVIVVLFRLTCICGANYKPGVGDRTRKDRTWPQTEWGLPSEETLHTNFRGRAYKHTHKLS